MDKIEREKIFHNKIFEEDTRVAVSKFYSITKSSRKYYLDFIVKNCAAKRVLEYGCGPGSSAFVLAKHNATVTGIDISEYAVSLASASAAKQQVQVDFQVMNAEKLGFADNSFELVCGSGIMHHLQLDRAYPELSRTLTAGGKAIFLEPLGHNPLINLYRKRTPNMRTEDEHPLLVSDLGMARKYFGCVDLRFFHLCSLAAVPLRKSGNFESILKAFDGTDRFLFKFLPFTRKYSWTVALVLAEPVKH